MEMKTYIGIDSGKNGAIAIRSTRYASNCRVLDMPIDHDKKEVDSEEIFSFLLHLSQNHMFQPRAAWSLQNVAAFALIEKAQVMPKQGIKGAFTYGRSYEAVITVLKLLKIPYQEISPRSWKKEFSLIKKDKAASVAIAHKLFPKIELCTKRGRLLDGRAEAILIAEYAKRRGM